jgi:hypothetical protein
VTNHDSNNNNNRRGASALAHDTLVQRRMRTGRAESVLVLDHDVFAIYNLCTRLHHADQQAKQHLCFRGQNGTEVHDERSRGSKQPQQHRERPLRPQKSNEHRTQLHNTSTGCSWSP